VEGREAKGKGAKRKRQKVGVEAVCDQCAKVCRTAGALALHQKVCVGSSAHSDVSSGAEAEAEKVPTRLQLLQPGLGEERRSVEVVLALRITKPPSPSMGAAPVACVWLDGIWRRQTGN
jgi:hypothetical protein